MPDQTEYQDYERGHQQGWIEGARAMHTKALQYFRPGQPQDLMSSTETIAEEIAYDAIKKMDPPPWASGHVADYSKTPRVSKPGYPPSA